MANTRIVCGRYKFNIKYINIIELAFFKKMILNSLGRPFARGAYGSIYLAEDKEYPDE